MSGKGCRDVGLTDLRLFLWLERRHAIPRQLVRPLILFMAGMALDPFPADIVPGDGVIQRAP